MKKPRLLDLFCCAGGAGMGYARAPSFEREPMKYLTIVYSLPAGFDVGTLTQHEFACAFAWSHKMDECNDLKAALRKANASTERFEREWYLRGDALEDWQKFAADVMPGCAAGAEWLDGLRNRTAELLAPNANVTGLAPGKDRK